jgi:hypothetical protein
MSDYTAADLANINQAIANGLTQAMIAGEMVQYRSLVELRQIKRMIEASLTPTAAPVAFQVRYVSTDRGV